MVDAEDLLLLRTRVGNHEAMEMIVLPAHRVLDGDMQIPKGRVARHLDLAPDQRVGLLQLDTEAQDERLSRDHHRTAALAQLRTPVCGRHRNLLPRAGYCGNRLKSFLIASVCR